MRTFVGIILMLLGLLFGAYIGIYEMLYKGILLIVEGINADPNNGSQIAMGILRIMFADLMVDLLFDSKTCKPKFFNHDRNI